MNAQVLFESLTYLRRHNILRTLYVEFYSVVCFLHILNIYLESPNRVSISWFWLDTTEHTIHIRRGICVSHLLSSLHRVWHRQHLIKNGWLHDPKLKSGKLTGELSLFSRESFLLLFLLSHDGWFTFCSIQQMGMDSLTSGLCWFVLRTNSFLVVPGPASSGRCLLRGNTPTSLPFLIWEWAPAGGSGAEM